MAGDSDAADRVRAYLTYSDAYPRENDPVIAQSEDMELELPGRPRGVAPGAGRGGERRRLL